MTGRHRRGEIRLRSNVVMAGDQTATAAAWEYVPGEIVGRYKPHFLSARGSSKRQRDERGYYLECAYCHRLAHEIGRQGCVDPRCIARPSEAAVAAAQVHHEDALALIEAEREHLDVEIVETGRQDLGELLDPEEAAARFLGLAAIAHAGEPEPAGAPVSGAEQEGPAVAVVKRALVEAAVRTGRFVDSYCESVTDNLVDTLTLGQARTALGELSAGDGSELKPQGGGSPKFCAAYSSSALAINTFAAWLGREPWLILAGRSGFTRLEFEAKFPTGLQGKPPNLDVVASGPTGIVAVESKCIEYLGKHEATFQPSYKAAIEELAHESWAALFHALNAEPMLLSGLGVGQLMRHYLGLRRAIVNGRVSSATLLYLYWEPDDAAGVDELAAHRDDVMRLAGRVADPTVTFMAMTYPALWAQWTAPGAPDWLAGHVAALRERYGVALTGR